MLVVRGRSLRPCLQRQRNWKTQLLRFDLPSTLIHHKNGTCRKPGLRNRRNLKTPDLRFRVDGNLLKTDDVNSKMTGVCCVLKFLRRNVWMLCEWSYQSTSTHLAYNCATFLSRDSLWCWPFFVSRPSSDTTDSKSVELKFKEPELVPERTPRDYTVHFPQEKSQELSKTYKTSGPVVPDTIRYQ